MPDWKIAIRERLKNARLEPSREAEIVDELDQHLSDRYNEMLGRGVSEPDALAALLAELDETDLTRELRRDLPAYAEPVAPGLEGRNPIASVWQDLRYAARGLRNNPGFTIVAVLSLALGIGANSAIFQLLDSVRMRALPVPAPQELALVKIADTNQGRSGSFSSIYPQITNPQWELMRTRQHGFASIAAFSSDGYNLSDGGPVRYARAIIASGDFFRVLQLQPLLGRLFNASDDQRGCGSPGVVLSYSFWQREYGGQSDVIGKTIRLESHPLPIIGVTSAQFYGVVIGRNFDVAVPLCAEQLMHGEDSRLDLRYGWFLGIVGRLKPGWTLEMVTAELQTTSPGIFQETLPPTYDSADAKNYLGFHLQALPGGNGVSPLRRQYESPLWLLLGVAGLVLFIACANLANLLLARATAREREVAVRLALGASRTRLVRQFLSESALLSFLGAAAGLALAQALSRFLVRFLSTSSRSMFLNVAPDWRTLAYTAGLAIATCLLFGLAPALRATRSSPAALMNTSGRGLTASRERFGLRRMLVVCQVATSLVLVVGALLFVRSLNHLLTFDAGFRESGVLVTDIDLTRLQLPPERRQSYKAQLLERIHSTPGIEFAATAKITPVSGNGWNNRIKEQESKGSVNINSASPGFFAVMGTPIISGRDFNERDTAASPHVVVINEMFAHKYLDGKNPIGAAFHIARGQGEPDPLYEVVGVVKNSKYSDIRDDFEPIVYLPEAQEWRPDQFTELLVRSQLPLATLTTELKRAIAKASPEIAIDFHPLPAQIREGLVRERLLAVLSGFFGILAALLATVGLYGVISYMVVRRTNEIGIRMALGARRADIARIIVREAAILVGSGALIGSLLALVAGRAASTLLYGLKPHDPLTLGAAIAALVVIGAVSSLLPASRAAKLDPMVALRVE